MVNKGLKQKIYTNLMGKGLYQSRIEWTKKAIGLIEPGSKVLDAGAGECKNKQYCAHLKYVSQDFCQYERSKDELKAPGESRKWDTSRIDIVSDIADIPVEPESFDAIICTEVLEHLLLPELAIKEFARIVKKGGRVIITAPANCGNHMMPFFFYNGLSEFWYKEILEKYGFVIESIDKNGNYFDVIKERVLSARVISEMYGKKMGVFSRVIGLFEGMILNYYSKKTRNSGNYICSEHMIIAKKVNNIVRDTVGKCVCINNREKENENN